MTTHTTDATTTTTTTSRRATAATTWSATTPTPSSRAAALDARVLRPMADTDYGSRGFSVADGEGNRWSFGTYAG